MKKLKASAWILLLLCTAFSAISLYLYSHAPWALRVNGCNNYDAAARQGLPQATMKSVHERARRVVADRNIPTIHELARVSEQEYACPPGNRPVFSTPPSNATTASASILPLPGYKIPFAIHQTCKSRCVSEEVFKYMKDWSNLGIPYYLHDDEAMDSLVLSGASNDFPQLQAVWTQCLLVPAARADLWRMLLLWTYGGIYADIDTKPKRFRPLTHIHPDDQMYALSDNEGLPSFHFMAAMPRHPLVFLVIQRSLNNVVLVPEVAAYNPARFTGPKAMRQALRSFLEGRDDLNNTQHQHIQSKDLNFTFRGMGGFTVRREGPKDVSDKIVEECAIENKREKYKSFNMTHYMDSGANKMNRTCFEALYKLTR